MIGKFKLMIADVVVVSCNAVAASLGGSSAAAASVAQVLKLSKAASAFVGFYVMNIADCFFVLVGFLSLESGFFELWWYKGPSFAAAASAAATPRVRKQQLHLRTWWRRRRFPLAACLKSTLSSFLTMLVKKGKKRRSDMVMGDTVLLVRGLQGTRLWFGVDRGGRLLICLLLFGAALLFLFIFSTWWWRGE